MKNPTLRVTKWLADIPVEACCSNCPDKSFTAVSNQHRPERLDFQQQLMSAFERHVVLVHKSPAA